MSTEPQNRQQTKDLRPEKTIFWPAVISILVISLPMLLFPKASEEIIGAIYQPLPPSSARCICGLPSLSSDCAFISHAAAMETSSSVNRAKNLATAFARG